MTVRRVLLCWSVAVSIGASFASCNGRDNQDFSAAKQSSPPWTEAGKARTRPPDELIAELIRTRIEAAGVVSELEAAGEPIYTSVALPGFYVRRLYRPAWIDKHGPNRLVEHLVGVLRRADLEGLRTEHYHLAAIETLLASMHADVRSKRVIVPDRLAELDLLLTDAFLVYGSHLLAGRVNPETLQPEWVANRRVTDFAAVLEATLASGNVVGTLATLEPPQPGFRRLREALVYYRAVVEQGGWPKIPDGPTLKRGDRGAPVAALRERLRLEGNLGVTEREDAEMFDEELEQALVRFQRYHGLTDDGAVGPATRAELNISAKRRVTQLELNLERWRWLPQNLGRRHIIVNIPAFELDVVEDEALVMTARVVVGLPFHHTPVFSDTMRYLVLNPYWHVPLEITVQEVLPRIKLDPSYLAQQQLRVFQGWGSETRDVDPATVDWSSITPDNFPFRLRQDSGPINALGRVKFMFPNKFNVYLHDTPTRLLFEEARRDFSHGCVRVQQPIELAQYLLRQDPRWSGDALLLAMEEAVDYTVPLPEPMPIHILYWTAWTDENGMIQFRRDIYGQDESLLEALRAFSPPNS